MFEFRLATAADLPAVNAIVAETILCPDKNLINGWDESYPTPEIFAEDVAAKQLWLAFEENSPVLTGFFVAMDDPSYDELSFWRLPGPSLAIHRLCVNPGLRGRGAAGAMLAHADRIAKDGGYASIRLDTFSANPTTARLYPRAGFSLVGKNTGRSGIYHFFEKAVE